MPQTPMALVREELEELSPEVAKEAFMLLTWTMNAPVACKQAIDQAKTMVAAVPRPDAYA